MREATQNNNVFPPQKERDAAAQKSSCCKLPCCAVWHNRAIFIFGGVFMTEHSFYMERAIQLAKRGIGFTNPNPLVGAVIVKDNRIIGEGWHAHYGDLHAYTELLLR